MGIADVLSGLKDKVLDAATYELLRRNFDLLEENNQQLKERLEFFKEEITKLKIEVQRLQEKNTGLQAIASLAESQKEFVEEKGLSFLQNPDGTVKPTAFCPECKCRLTTIDHRIYRCRKCKYTINPRNSAEIIADNINKRIKAQQGH